MILNGEIDLVKRQVIPDCSKQELKDLYKSVNKYNN